MGAQSTAEKWSHLNVRTTDLPTGGQAELEPADMTELLYGDPLEGIEPVVPNDLVAIAERVEFAGVDAEKMDPEERRQLARYRHWLIADRLRRYTHPDGSTLNKLTPREVRKLPYEDQIAMFRVCTHSDLAQRVMLASFRGVQRGPEGNGSGSAAGGGPE